MSNAVRSLAASLAPLFRRIEDADESILDDQIAIARVPAPTGGEAERAELMVRRLRAAGLCKVAIDAAGNALSFRGTKSDSYAPSIPARRTRAEQSRNADDQG